MFSCLSKLHGYRDAVHHTAYHRAECPHLPACYVTRRGVTLGELEVQTPSIFGKGTDPPIFVTSLHQNIRSLKQNVVQSSIVEAFSM